MAATDPINVFDDLQPVYGEGERAGRACPPPCAMAPVRHLPTLLNATADTEAARARYETLKQAFVDRFGAAPEAYARSPGAA